MIAKNWKAVLAFLALAVTNVTALQDVPHTTTQWVTSVATVLAGSLSVWVAQNGGFLGANAKAVVASVVLVATNLAALQDVPRSLPEWLWAVGTTVVGSYTVWAKSNAT